MSCSSDLEGRSSRRVSAPFFALRGVRGTGPQPHLHPCPTPRRGHPVGHVRPPHYTPAAESGMIATHLPHSAPTSAHRRSRKVKGLPTPVPAVTTGAQSLRAVPGQSAQPSGGGPRQGPLQGADRAAPGLPEGAAGGGRGRRSAVCGARAPFTRRRRRCGTRRPLVAAARPARLRQPRTLSLVLKAAAAPLPARSASCPRRPLSGTAALHPTTSSRVARTWARGAGCLLVVPKSHPHPTPTPLSCQGALRVAAGTESAGDSGLKGKSGAAAGDSQGTAGSSPGPRVTHPSSARSRVWEPSAEAGGAPLPRTWDLGERGAGGGWQERDTG